MDLDTLLFLLSCIKERITQPVTGIEATPNHIRVAMIDGTNLYLTNHEVVDDERASKNM